MLQISSTKAEQMVTIQCKNVETSTRPASFTGFKRGVQLQPQTLSNGCEVGTNPFSVKRKKFQCIFFLQEQSAKKSSSVYSFSTSKPKQLPVMDVSMWLGKESNEAVGIDSSFFYVNSLML